MTLVRLWCGEEGRLGGSWMMLRAGVVLPSSIVAVRCDPAPGVLAVRLARVGTRFCAGRGANHTTPSKITANRAGEYGWSIAGAIE
jgi:hypothetical protein